MKVLVADDDMMCRETLAMSIQADGHDVVTVKDGEEALEALNRDQFGLLVSDWQMPHITGPELCRRIRAKMTERYVYIVLLTSREDRRSMIEGLHAGADDFLIKPFDPEELSVRIRGAERVLSLQTRDLAIFAMAKLAESRDADTGAHLERVRTYCRTLAIAMSREDRYKGEVDDEFVRLIYDTSPLHDIGKVGIPDAVLLKPAKLTAGEFEIMKGHTTIGARTLEAALEQFPNARFLNMARDIAWAHHEQYGGGGYPRGLRATDIPLAARVVSFADMYDALRSKRIYKPSLTHEESCSIIREASGKQLDPDIVPVFDRVSAEFESIAQSLSDEGHHATVPERSHKRPAA